MYVMAITDDLTGAADSGGYFTDRGQALTIFTGEDGAFQPVEGRIVSVNLSSRNVTGAEAKRRHYELCRRLAGGPERLYMKKIGTGFRGRDAFELEGMLEAMPGYLCFLIDNAPDLGTFTLYGHQYCEGQILTKSLYAKDPIFPPTRSYIPEILGQDTDLPVALVDLDAVKGGDLLEAVGRAVEAGNRIIVFDAVTAEDTLHIIETLQPHYPKVFWTGSLGLADALASYLYGPPHPRPAVRRDIRSVCFCASAYETARRQIAYSARRGLNVVRLDVDALRDGDTGAVARAVDEMIGAGGDGNVLLAPCVERWSGKPGTSEAIMEAFGACAPAVCGALDFQRLVVIGGETAQRIFRAMDIRQISLSGKPEPGIAEGVIDDGDLAGREFALKGGSVGSDQALEKMLCRWGGEEEET